MNPEVEKIFERFDSGNDSQTDIMYLFKYIQDLEEQLLKHTFIFDLDEKGERLAIYLVLKQCEYVIKNYTALLYKDEVTVKDALVEVEKVLRRIEDGKQV
jgi:hypothetical protein